MNELKKVKMKQERKVVSGYRSLMMSKHYISLCLIVSFFLVSYYGYAPSPIYILLIFYLLPPIIENSLKEYIGKRKDNFISKLIAESPFYLTTLQKKYRFNKLNYVSNSMVYIIILLWFYNKYWGGTSPRYLFVIKYTYKSPTTTFVLPR
ncbi:hypothetical protein I5677_16255 [Mobilitalea sibirica]|uniref:Uncharacterized protein n=1 Tax=Mobilitalea sibirica TaxID=1462919 RepID=A0A8J7HCL2_9FIRM|nr:hypothetical protein [Mobilitalea sibirica]MBH1942455.1 hypothetical protein [Mobilitalea sibirica]